MNQVKRLAVLILAFAACDAEDNTPPPPAYSGQASAQSEPVSTCEDFMWCNIRCSEIELDKHTTTLRKACVDECMVNDLPETGMPTNVLVAWANSCAEIGRETICPEGLLACEHSER